MPLFGAAAVALHKKWSFPLRISSVTFTEEIPNGKFHFLCSVVISTDRLYTVKAEFRLLTGPNTAHGVLWFCDNEKFNIGLIWIWQKLSSIGVLKICSIFSGEHPCRRVTLIKLQSSFIEITLRHVFCPVNLLHIFRTLFPKNTYGAMLLI